MSAKGTHYDWIPNQVWDDGGAFGMTVARLECQSGAWNGDNCKRV